MNIGIFDVSLAPKLDISKIISTEQNSSRIISSKQNSTIQKTHQIALGAIISGACVSLLLVIAFATLGGGIAVTVAAVVSVSMIYALKTGAIVGAAVGLILTPLAFYLIKLFILQRDIPKEELQKLDEEFFSELENPLLQENPLLNGVQASPLGVYSLNDGFITADSAESLEFKLQLIEKAEQSIEIMPNYFSGEVMARVLKIIETRLENKPDLKVHIMASSLRIRTSEEWERFNELTKKFPGRFHVIFIPYMPTINPEPKIYDNHMKMVVVDEKYFVLGGTSLIDEFSGKGDEKPLRAVNQNLLDRILAAGFRDHDLVGKGPLAKTLRLAFYRQYATWEYMLDREKEKFENHYFCLSKSGNMAQIDTIDSEKRLVCEAKMKLIISTPHSSEEKECTKEYQRIISKAKELEIGNLCFDPPKDILEALDQALDNGATIKILTNGIDGEEIPLQNYFMALPPRAHYRYLNKYQRDEEKKSLNNDSEQRRELDVFEYDVPDTSYHAKILAAKSIDDVEEGIIGSFNLSYRGDTGDDELIVVFENSDLVHQIQNVLETDRKLSRKITVEKFPSITEKFATPIDNLFFRFA
jgi:phosphatidylserine/phosphatidylglycerophosphate/cardiolipin synthase-like enzyme